jgi:transglutaminase-like putative cysteine protease
MTDDKIHPEFDWVAFSLLCAMVLISAWALVATEWTDSLYLIPLAGLVGVFAGTALARSRFTSWVALIFASIYGFFITGWQLGSTLDPALSWASRAQQILGRLGLFVAKSLAGEPNEDSFVFVALMVVFFWVIGAWGGWMVFRREAVWPTILLTGISIAIFTYYYYGIARLGLYTAALSLVALILAARLDITSRLNWWTGQKARVPADAVFRVSISALIATIVIVGLAWGGPAFAKSEMLYDAWQSFSEPFEGAKGWFENAFSTIEGATRVIPTEYGETLALGSGSELLDLTIMSVEPAKLPFRGGRFYWRSRIYDRYEQNQWTGPELEPELLDPREGQWSLGSYLGRENIEVTVSPQGAAIKLLYVPSQPLWVDRTSEMTILRNNDGTLDVLSIEADRLVREGESYRTVASVASPSAEQMRNAGADYPDWVLDRNLQLPETITARTRELAEQITAGLETPYDKTEAITRWLRQNMEYSRTIDQPPLDQDPIDWFLFDYKVGYCNFYASAEVILLRSLGIPARMAAGYARGEYVDFFYEVNTTDSHSWPEVFFPGLGWVEFEPTISEPTIARPESFTLAESARFGGPDQDPETEEGIDPEEWLDELLGPTETVADYTRIRRRQTILRNLGIGVFSTIALAWLWFRINPASWTRMKIRLGRIAKFLRIEVPESLEMTEWEWRTATGQVYAKWSGWLRRLGLSKGPWETPNERAKAFALAVPQSADAARILVDAYVRERFAEQGPRDVEVRRAWRQLRVQLWLAWLRKLTTRRRET